jgi:hypothetical protein
MGAFAKSDVEGRNLNGYCGAAWAERIPRERVLGPGALSKDAKRWGTGSRLWGVVTVSLVCAEGLLSRTKGVEV